MYYAPLDSVLPFRRTIQKTIQKDNTENAWKEKEEKREEKIRAEPIRSAHQIFQEF